MFDPLSTAIATEIGKVVIKTVWDGSGKVLGMFGRTADEATQKLIYQASQTYVKKYGDRHGIIQVLGMQEPVKLEEIYTAVQFLVDRGLQGFGSIESLEEAYLRAKQRSFQDKNHPKQDGLTVANETQYLMVLGEPGTGKSTFLKQMGLEALKGAKDDLKYGCIPVLIELRSFNNREIDFENAIAEEFRLCGFPNHEEQTEKLLTAGKLLVLLDGLDEVATEQMNDAIDQIQSFVTRYSKNRFIAACRVAAYRHNLPAFTTVTIAAFDIYQIYHFITNWFRNEPGIATVCARIFTNTYVTTVTELTQTPLLLTLVCLLYQQSRKCPTNRATLYERALRVLLEEWAADESKETHQKEIYKGLDTKRKEILLSKIAHDAFQQNRRFLTRREITNQIERLLQEMLPHEKVIDGAAVLRSIEVQQGILVERAEGIYSFSHLMFQEYFTAQYIDDHHQIELLVVEHVADRRWQEVFLITAGLLRGGANNLLLLMEKTAAQQLINTDNLKNLLHWAEQATEGSEGAFHPAAKRLLALAFSRGLVRPTISWLNYSHIRDRFRTRRHTLSLFLPRNQAPASTHSLTEQIMLALPRGEQAIASIWSSVEVFSLSSFVTYSEFINSSSTRRLIHEFEELKIFKAVNFAGLIAELEVLQANMPDQKEPIAVRQPFEDRVWQTWYTALHLNPDWVNLSTTEAANLDRYLYVNELMVRCKEAAVRVSPQVWAGIEERMLTVRDEG